MKNRHLKAGTIIDEKYRVDKFLGGGGMGSVYKGTHLALDKEIAIKLLHEQYAKNENHKVRFEREAKVASKLDHENAVSVFDFGTFEEKNYIVMEYLKGKPLHKICGGGRPMETTTALQLAWQIANVLVQAHAMGLIHRDLKPENVMIETKADGSSRAVVVDFGLAFVQDSKDLSRMTKEGIVSGTPAFVSPEQARGSMDIAGPSDIYSLGCMFHEMFTGHLVFTGKSVVGLLNSHMFVPPNPIRESYPEAHVSIALETLILRMLEKDAQDRPTASEVRDWLGQLLNKEAPRERGRPAQLLQPRSERALTLSPGRLARKASKNSNHEQVEIGIFRELEDEWIVSLASAGFSTTKIDIHAQVFDVPVLFIPQLTLEDVEVLSKKCVLITTLDIENIDELTEYMRAGAFDIITEPVVASELVRKIERAWKKAKRNK